MIKNDNRKILVVNDVEATLDGIEELLTRDGYRVEAARDEREAAEKARLSLPDLMLVSLDGEVGDIVVAAKRIRSLAGLNDDLPIVIFCAELDLTQIDKEKMTLDVSGHYSRPDVFDFAVNRKSRRT